MTGQQLKIKALALLIMLLFVSSSFAGYILVLKSGRKIYSDKPFEEKENGIYVTLPNDMVVYIKKKDIDYEATKALVDKIRKQKIEREQKEASEQKSEGPEIVEKTESPPVLATESKNKETGPKTESLQSKPPKVENQQTNTSSKLGEITDTPKSKTNKIKLRKTEPPKQASPEKTVNSNGAFRLDTRKSPYPDYGIPVENIDPATITLDELIDTARGVQWEYSGICPICHGTGNSPLSTPTNVIVCTYCNGTGKSGAWNDEVLKIGDDCPWCVLGYDELGKGPCRHCLGTGRYLGLDRLNLLESSSFDEDKNEVEK